MNWISKLLCRLGMHGPRWCGPESQHRSSFLKPFHRRCEVCRTVWVGEEVAGRYYRKIGNWKRLP